jgi:hypothetical protein
VVFDLKTPRFSRGGHFPQASMSSPGFNFMIRHAWLVAP